MSANSSRDKVRKSEQGRLLAPGENVYSNDVFALTEDDADESIRTLAVNV
jgi:hypothetical protein